MAEPRNELSVRQQDAGGDVWPEVKPLAAPDPRGRGRFILLIHGYNNAYQDAQAKYQTFLDHLGKYLNDHAPNRVNLEDVYKFYWPGDEKWGALSFASYPIEIGPAKDSARVLAKFVAGLWGPPGGQMEIFLIAHSLGNRLVLETLNLLRGRLPPGVVLRYACLMAAAVPVGRVDTHGELHDAAMSTSTLVLCSKDDTVLHWAFPLGETLAGEGFFPHAVGRVGEPTSLWTQRPQPMDGYLHKSYWSGEDKSGRETDQTSRQVLRIFGIPADNVIATASIPDRSLPTATGPAAGMIPGRTLPWRPTFG